MHKVVSRDFVCSPSVHFPWPTVRHWINSYEVVPGRKSYSVAYFDQITVFQTNAQVLLYFVTDRARVIHTAHVSPVRNKAILNICLENSNLIKYATE